MTGDDGAAAMSDVPTPDWVAAEMWVWLSRFGVSDYRMRVHMEPLTDTDEVRTRGMATVQARYLSACLTFCTSLQQDAEGRHVIAHECGHVLLGEVAAIVQHLIDQLPARARPLAYEMWDDASDRTIERLTRALEGELHP